MCILVLTYFSWCGTQNFYDMILVRVQYSIHVELLVLVSKLPWCPNCETSASSFFLTAKNKGFGVLGQSSVLLVP